MIFVSKNKRIRKIKRRIVSLEECIKRCRGIAERSVITMPLASSYFRGWIARYETMLYEAKGELKFARFSSFMARKISGEGDTRVQ